MTTDTMNPDHKLDPHHKLELETPSPEAPLGEPFDRDDIKAFSNDDTEAGQAICKMLSLFFFYTVIVMGLSTYVTYRWIMGG